MKFICAKCKKKFVGKCRGHLYKFCSHRCYGQSLIGRSNQRKEKIDRGGYWYVYKPEHSNAGKQGYIAEHRIIIEKHINRILSKNEVVHHINNIKKDNRLANLQLFSSCGQHTKIAHPDAAQKGGESTRNGKMLNCLKCGKTFYRCYSTISKHKNHFCSLECYHKYIIINGERNLSV